MKRVLLTALLLAVTCTAACATPAPPPPPLNAQLSILVVDRAGLPIPDAQVTAQRLTPTGGGQQVSLPITSTTTDPTGQAAVAVPRNATVQVGVWKGAGQPVWRWQTPVIVTGDVDLAYRLVTADTLPLCPAVDPTTPDRCPQG